MVSTLETIVRNKSKNTVELKMSNAGANLKMCTIRPAAHYCIRTEPNGTYREYLVATVNVEGARPLSITSDDCIENKEILIEDGVGAGGIAFGLREIDIVRVPRDPGEARGGQQGFWSRIWEKLLGG